MDEICRETGDHVHYRRKRLRPRVASSPSGTGSSTTEDSVNCPACGSNCRFHREYISNARNGVNEAVLEALKRSSGQLRQILGSPYGEGKEPSVGDRMSKDGSRGGDVVEEGRVKRLKTKFTAEQTEKMRNYAEKLGWTVSRERREEVDEFCVKIGVKIEKFRVWMNNHKEKN